MKAASAATVGLLGGALCLDFANTVEPRRGDGRRDYLGGYVDLVRWAEHAGALEGGEARRLLRVAEARASDARSSRRASSPSSAPACSAHRTRSAYPPR